MTRWNPLLNPGAVFVNGKEQESPANACMSLSRCWEEGRRVREKEEGGRNAVWALSSAALPRSSLLFPHGKGNTSPNAALGSRSCLKGAPDMR